MKLYRLALTFHGIKKEFFYLGEKNANLTGMLKGVTEVNRYIEDLFGIPAIIVDLGEKELRNPTPLEATAIVGDLDTDDNLVEYLRQYTFVVESDSL